MGDQLPDVAFGDGAGFQVGFQQRFIAHGHSFQQALFFGGEVYAGVAQLGSEVCHQFFLGLAGQIHFADKEDRGDPIALQKIPEGGGVSLKLTADHQHGAVQNGQDPLCLRGEIHVAGGVHQGNGPMCRFQLGLLGKNGDAPCPFQGMGIQKGIGVVHPPQSSPGTAAVQKRLGQGGLTRVHMGQQSYTAGHLISLRRHKNTPFKNVFRIISRKPPFVDRYAGISFEFLGSATCRAPVCQMEKSDKNGQKTLYEYHKNGKFDLCN